MAFPSKQACFPVTVEIFKILTVIFLDSAVKISDISCNRFKIFLKIFKDIPEKDFRFPDIRSLTDSQIIQDIRPICKQFLNAK